MNKKFITYILIGNLLFISGINASPASSLPSLTDVKNFVFDKRFAGGAMTALSLGYVACLALKKSGIKITCSKCRENYTLFMTTIDCPKCNNPDPINL